jgi:large subunit ribosomal protein L17
MRHRNKINHLGRDTQHRKALMSNLAVSLIENKHITTTTAKAKALRRYIEPILTRAKSDSTHNRRIVFSQLRQKSAIDTLFGEVAEKIASRPGGYTRVIKIGNRPGDNADLALIELVDFSLLNGGGEATAAAAEPTTKKRTRRGGKKSGPKTADAKLGDKKAERKHSSTTAAPEKKRMPRKVGGS